MKQENSNRKGRLGVLFYRNKFIVGTVEFDVILEGVDETADSLNLQWKMTNATTNTFLPPFAMSLESGGVLQI